MRVRTPVLAIFALIWLVVVHRITGLLNIVPLLGLIPLAVRAICSNTKTTYRILKQEYEMIRVVKVPR